MFNSFYVIKCRIQINFINKMWKLKINFIQLPFSKLNQWKIAGAFIIIIIHIKFHLQTNTKFRLKDNIFSSNNHKKI
jgi:hypothetical protein